MATLLLQYDDRDTKIYTKLIENNKIYCKSLNYHYKFISDGYTNLPPYWRKVFLVRDHLNLYDKVLWVDSDATIVAHESVDTLFKPNTHFAFSSNPSLYHKTFLDMLSAPFCAGVWCVKNTPEGKSIMDYWCSKYDQKSWFIENGKWKAHCVYGGICYEQGSFEVFILRTKNFSNWLSQWEHHKLNYLPLDDRKIMGTFCPNVFAIHYWTGNRDYISKHWDLKK